MTFKEISTRMLRRNYKRYLLYFYCNVFTIAVFNTFSEIYLNDDFMNPRIVNSLISSNICAPTLFTAIFMFLFIPYSYSAFFRKRKSEYGILMTLGMTEKEVLINMLSENLTISFLSLVAGMAGGTALSLLFFGIIKNVIGINVVSWSLSLKSYAITAGLYLAIVGFTLLLQMLGFVKTQITDMLKAGSRGEGKVKTSVLNLIVGFILSAGAVILLTMRYSTDSWALLISFVLMMAGAWLVLGYLKELIKSRPKETNAGKSFVIAHFRSFRTVTFIAVCLFGIGIFLTGLSLVMYPNITNNAKSYSPNDLLYVQAGGKNEMSIKDASDLLSNYGINVTSSAEVPFIRNGAYNLFPVSEINHLTGADYKVNQGEYLAIYQYDLNDGYEHEMNISGSISFDLSTGTRLLNYAGSDVRILFNRNSFAYMSLLVSDADYKTIEEQGKGFISGIIKCFTFSDFKDSGRGLTALSETLSSQNHCVDADQERYFRISSKLEEYQTAEQSTQFLFFVISFTALLFYVSADVIIYFKLQGEAEDEKLMYRGLNRIGISGSEIHGILNGKNKLHFLLPAFFGAAVGIFFCFAVSLPNGYGLYGIAYAAVVSVFLLLVQVIVLICVTRTEEKMLGV